MNKNLGLLMGGQPFSQIGDKFHMLDAQLDAAARAFINDPRYNRLEGDTL